jgi:hypothetical protein
VSAVSTIVHRDLAPAKLKSTEVRRVRRGVTLRRVCIALPPQLLNEFRAVCVRDGTCVSSKIEEWVNEYLATIASETPRPRPQAGAF